MSSRPGFVVDHRVPADGGTPPNQYVGQVSVQVRCNWPPRATRDEVSHALYMAYLDACRALEDHERPPVAS